MFRDGIAHNGIFTRRMILRHSIVGLRMLSQGGLRSPFGEEIPVSMLDPGSEQVIGNDGGESVPHSANPRKGGLSKSVCGCDFEVEDIEFE